MTKLLANTGLGVAVAGVLVAALKAAGVPIDDTTSAAVTAVVSALIGLVAALYHPGIPIGPKTPPAAPPAV